ncbi:guanine nucleotide exchange factor MON1 [Aspergillus brunneoviolaceus CBS 621.78]|uniref:DUF254-domain-containing protein n=1 Tax=Aspergillus brunneoviolaceus CBS 621.78 TaxID=1450534 RepID=A0ACD1FZN9_9EURO|nr:DUF254-domain-containing protein [Aspergillus brunneoviolaceus CBS 621.78]RAH42444.1 DUF254-domain-containing protein [Aspergillus brunneoviolaceus CBS 621.78]
MVSTADGPAQDANNPETENSAISPPPSSSLQQPSVSADRESEAAQEEERPPPLPPRPNTLRLLDEGGASLRTSRPGAPTNLQSRATTAVSLTDIGCHDAGKESHVVREGSETLKAQASLNHLTSSRGSETGDTASIRSSGPQGDIGDVENVFGDFVATDTGLIRKHSTGLLQFPEFQADDVEDDFASEFEPVGEVDEEGGNEEEVLANWKAKRKHYLILSAAGKPIWTRHGDGGLISTYIGVIQTIISFYEDSKDPLSSFTAGDTKFVIVTKGPLHLVAISRMLESDTQLKLQLEALYMQILSTLTLPSLTHLFSIRPSTDLKRPLQGSETLLSTLADSFTKGSPSTLLSALECLKIRKSHRQAINNTLLKTKVSSLLYGLVVAGGRLVNVVRPKKHSLHPGDLQLLFNMIFEAEAVKAGGGESWIPVCLPGFNSSGYLYMYVSFLDLRDDANAATNDTTTTTKEESVAIVLISADKESFFELQGMRDAFVEVCVFNLSNPPYHHHHPCQRPEANGCRATSKWRETAASRSSKKPSRKVAPARRTSSRGRSCITSCTSRGRMSSSLCRPTTLSFPLSRAGED